MSVPGYLVSVLFSFSNFQKIKYVPDYGRVEYTKTGKVRRVNHILEDITKKKHCPEP